MNDRNQDRDHVWNPSAFRNRVRNYPFFLGQLNVKTCFFFSFLFFFFSYRQSRTFASRLWQRQEKLFNSLTNSRLSWLPYHIMLMRSSDCAQKATKVLRFLFHTMPLSLVNIPVPLPNLFYCERGLHTKSTRE